MTSIFMYLSVLVLIATIASIGYRPGGDGVNISIGAAQAAADMTKPSVDQLAVAGLAASTADVASLAVANDASSASITLNIKSELAQQDEAVITKPQTFQPVSSNAIISYKVVAGDTVPSIAARYGITDETVRWANNLTSDALAPGSDMLIPTVDGVVYTTKNGDTLDSIASKYQSDKARIVSKNNLELATGLASGQLILLPGGVLPINERPGYVIPRARTTVTNTAALRSSSVYSIQAGNRYAYGNCTWYAYNRRMQIGRPIGSMWGNASSWVYAARSAGYIVTQGNPGVGDVMQGGGGYAGHVAVVENLYPDGSIRVSEMNYYANGGGWNIVSYRTVDPGSVGSYNFIK